MPPRGSQKAMTTKPKRKVVKKLNGNVSGEGSRRTHKESTVARLSELLRANPLDIAETQVVKTDVSTHGNNLTSTRRLATIVHGIFLVTMTTKAQLGVFQGKQNVTTTADERWFGALVLYCGFTVVVWDIIECAALFNDWFQVSVTIKPQYGTEEDNIKPSGGATVTTSSTDLIKEEAIVAKLKLLRRGVPSVSEAETFLQERWGQNEGWRRNTALSLQNLASKTMVRRSESGLSLTENGGSACGPISTAYIDIDNDNNSNVNIDSNIDVSDEELLGRLSKELRTSLSEKKLRDVVTQMRREEMGVDAKEHELVTQRQRRERLLATYDLLRVILGEKRSVCNMTQLVNQMALQNRFGDDKERVLEQIASLARYRESGILIFTFDVESEWQQQQRGWEVKGDSSLLLTREVDVSQCSQQELETVLLRLDRRTASRGGLHAVLQRE